MVSAALIERDDDHDDAHGDGHDDTHSDAAHETHDHSTPDLHSAVEHEEDDHNEAHEDASGEGNEAVHILIGGKFLDPALHAQALLVPEYDFRPNGAPTDAGYGSFQLRDPSGKTVGYLTWALPKPGRLLLWKTAPVVLLLAVHLLCGSWVVARYSAAQTEAYLKERVSARTDPVTGLLNRTGLADIVADDDVVADIEAGRVAILYVDLNGLKRLNDVFGHAVGDEAIRVTANRLRACGPKQNHIARVGGDEFVCLITADDPAQAAHDTATCLHEEMGTPVILEGQSFLAEAAIGVALSKSGITWDVLLGQADTAMYHAKRSKLPRAVVFDATLASLDEAI
jgi:diguanylate cyclase (GGDEF)-like protein